jgi:polysaccharide biosynthesis transport protein
MNGAGRDDMNGKEPGRRLPARRDPALPQNSTPGRMLRRPEEQARPLGSYLRILRERWWIIAASFAVVTIGVAAGSALSEPAYRATGSIEIRKQAAEVVPMEALFQYERISDQYLQTEYATLRSKALLQRTFEDGALAERVHAATLAGEGGEPDGRPDAARLAARHHKRVNVDPLAGSRIVRVSFESVDPVLAADVVNTLIGEYAEMRQEAAAAALVRLAEQADSLRTHLLAAENGLQRFVRETGLSSIVIAGVTGETVPQERLRRLQQELTQAEAEGYRAAAVSAADAPQHTAAMESDLLRSLRNRIAELQGEYARGRPTFTDSFPRVRQLRSELAQLDSLVALEQRRVAAAQSNQHVVTQRNRALLQRAVQEQQQLIETYAANLAEYERRRRDVEVQKQLYEALQQKQKEAALSAGLSRMDIAVLDAAAPPTSPIRPHPKRDIPLGAITGLMLGIGLAFLREYTDTSLRSPEEVEELGSAPLLAMIPAMPSQLRAGGAALTRAGHARSWHRIDRGADANAALGEAFRGLRTSVLYSADGPLPRTLLVTSSSPGDGKTTVSTNFALSLAMLGHRVLLVDADMRRPSLHRVFGVPAQPGLREELAGIQSWNGGIRRDVSPGLDLLPAGMRVSNPADLLAGGAVTQWLADAEAEYDFVVIDSPALFINAPDARLLSRMVDGVLLVVRSGATSREVVNRLVGQTPNLVGIILNQLSLRRLPQYYAEYGATMASHASGTTGSRTGGSDGSATA